MSRAPRWLLGLLGIAPPAAAHRCRFAKYHMRDRAACVYQCRTCGSFYGLVQGARWRFLDRRPESVDRRMREEP